MRMENTNNTVWKTKDYKERTVELRNDDRQHIYDHHSSMKNGDNIHQLKTVVESPEVVYQSAEYPKREVFISKSTGFTYASKVELTKIIIHYDTEHSGHVVTAFPVKRVGGNIGEKLYPEVDV